VPRPAQDQQLASPLGGDQFDGPPGGDQLDMALAELLDSEDPGLLREPLRAWMAAGRDGDERAGIVFETWLRCGGESALIEGALARWLGAHTGARG